MVGAPAELIEDVRRTLMADSRFANAGKTIHCDGVVAPLTNIYAVRMGATDWEGVDPVRGMPDPRTMSTLVLECRSAEWVAEIGGMVAGVRC
jgi:hypothetical protein